MPMPQPWEFKDTLKPDATIEQVRAAQDQVTKTYEELAKASENLAQQRAEAVKAAEADFNAAVAAVPDNATLAQAAVPSATKLPSSRPRSATSGLRSSASGQERLGPLGPQMQERS